MGWSAIILYALAKVYAIEESKERPYYRHKGN